MKPASQAAKRASAVLSTMLTAAATPSGQIGQEQTTKPCATGGKNRQDSIEAQREYAGMDEKHPFNKNATAAKTLLEAEREKRNNRETACGEGRQDAMNGKADEAGGEQQRRRAAMEPTIPDNEAAMGKAAAENAVRGLRRSLSIPKEQRIPSTGLGSIHNGGGRRSAEQPRRSARGQAEHAAG